jgi:hypothetical protein
VAAPFPPPFIKSDRWVLLSSLLLAVSLVSFVIWFSLVVVLLLLLVGGGYWGAISVIVVVAVTVVVE